MRLAGKALLVPDALELLRVELVVAGRILRHRGDHALVPAQHAHVDRAAIVVLAGRNLPEQIPPGRTARPGVALAFQFHGRVEAPADDLHAVSRLADVLQDTSKALFAADQYFKLVGVIDRRIAVLRALQQPLRGGGGTTFAQVDRNAAWVVGLCHGDDPKREGVQAPAWRRRLSASASVLR